MGLSNCAAGVVLLGDVLEAFPMMSLTRGNFEMDQAKYGSARQMASDGMWKKTSARLDRTIEPAIYLMIESGILARV